ncbi:SpnB-like Rossmann fold domain-containing protein [Archangium sp.]|uniref:SpnB-like Rossmann fold domain-containing protein n=1 Tax=Archangium sp. TaxID=1872627 RepID=UPI002D512EAC|nr:thioesterase domain-containing protein [Archangium sp.]HYO58954.1 thioesterase domain-containing protein [Archangium sp.]
MSLPRSAPPPAWSRHEATGRALALLQAYLADARLASCRLVLVTRRAVATHADEDVADLVHTPLWGLVRSAQAEHPHQAIVLLDTDDSQPSRRALAPALDDAEPQLALREGCHLAPRLARLLAVRAAVDSHPEHADLPRFARALAGERSVWALPHPPGYARGEALPVDRDAVLRAYTASALRAGTAAPFAVVGYSAAGWVAHALVSELERGGIYPTALVLIDTYLRSEISSRLISIFLDASLRIFPSMPWGTDELTAQAWYQTLFPDWTPDHHRPNPLRPRPGARTWDGGRGRAGRERLAYLLEAAPQPH